MRLQGINRALHRVLHYQSIFHSHHAYFRPLSMASSHSHPTSPKEDPSITRTLDFWFPSSPFDPVARWFAPNSTLDSDIRTQFQSLIASAGSHALDSWTQTPRGTLALLILLDQFPRNVFRGSKEAHATDEKALEIATRAVARGQDRDGDIEGPMQTTFFYMPFMHAESLVSQVACVALCEALKARCEKEEEKEFVDKTLWAARKHVVVVERFGRFPKRNNALGRESTVEEVKFLEENPSGL